MSKKVKITPELEQALRFSVGDDALLAENFSIFEVVAASNKPLSKGGLWLNGIISTETLELMAETLNSEGGAKPLQVMHETSFLPIGRVFNGQVRVGSDGYTSLFTYIAIPNDKVEFISDIENSVIDSVSIGVQFQEINCSECGFNYIGEKADWTNYATLTCNEGHTIGKDGVHAKLVGLKKFMELSLVNTGAVPNAKILPKSKQTQENNMYRLAASSNGEDKGLFILNASLVEPSSTKNLTTNPTIKGDNMEKSEIKTLLTSLESKIEEGATLKAQLNSLNSEVVELKASLEIKDKRISELEASVKDPEELTQLKAKLESEESEKAKVLNILATHYKAALTASSEDSEVAMPNSIEEILTGIEKRGLKLHQLFASSSAPGSKADIGLKNKININHYKIKE